MARLRVLGENPPPPRGNGENQLRELRDYLTRLKDELEYLLTHLGEDNLDDQTLARIREIDNVSGEADNISREVDNINTAVDYLNWEVENINTALAGKQDALTFDSVPTSGSDNPAKSGGIYSALSEKQNAMTFDDAPTSGSSNPVKSGGVYTALAGKQDTLTFDNVPSPGSNNPVKSSGIFDGLQRKANRNYISNWYFVGGGTGRGVFPVNTRGLSSYNTSGQQYTIDAWQKNSHVRMILQSNCVAVYRDASGSDNIHHYVESPEAMAGMTCTFSALVSGDSDTAINLGYTDGGGNTYGALHGLDSSIRLLTYTFTLSAAPTQVHLILRGTWPDGTSKIYLYAAKLELGDKQTLAHQENGAWVLNDTPDYEIALLQCQNSTANSNNNLANHMSATAEMFGPVEFGSKAANAYTGAGKLFTWNGNLYKTKTAISVNDTLADGTNCEQTTIAALLNM